MVVGTPKMETFLWYLKWSCMIVLLAGTIQPTKARGSKALTPATQNQNPVSRANYGVLFTPIKTIYPASSVWVHLFKLKLPPWMELVKFQSKTICDPGTPARDSRYTIPAPTHLPPDECGQSFTDCPGIIEQEINPIYKGAQAATNEYKCIVQDLLIKKFSRLKVALIKRYNYLRREALRLTSRNSTGSSRRTRKKRSSTIMSDMYSETAMRLKDRIFDLSKFESIWGKVENETQDMMRDIQKGIPRMPTKNRRVKRNPFAWIGKNLFGLATNADLDRMGRVVEHMFKAQSATVDQFEALREDTTSFMELVSKRLDTVTENIVHLYDMLKANARALAARSTANAQLMVYSAAVVSSLIEKTSEISLEVDRFSEGIRSLIGGRLSPTLIGQDVMLDVIDSLQDRLRRDYSAFHLTETDPQYYYRYAKVHHFRTDDDTLYVTMTLPLSAVRKMFFLYSVTIFNSPLKQHSEFTSRLRTKADYFGVTEDGRNFIELTQKEYSQCEDTSAVRCSSAIKIFDVEHPTCMSALYMDKPKDIHELCSFRFEKTVPTVEMMDVGGGKLVVMNADFMIIQCQQDTPSQKPGCSYCRVDFLCGCAIYIANNISNAAMPARLTNCAPKWTEYNVEFPVNLAVLANAFDMNEMEGIGGDEFFSQEYIPNLPEIQMAKKFEVNLNRDYAYSMDLRSVIKSAKEKRPVSPISQQIMASWFISQPVEFFSLSNVLALVAILVAAAACVDSWRTRRSLTQFKLSVQTMAAWKSADLPLAGAESYDETNGLEKMYKMFGDMKEEVQEITGETGLMSVPASVMLSHNWIVGMGIIALILTCGYLLYELYTRRLYYKIRLYIEVASADKVVSMPVAKLPGAPPNYHFRISGVPRVVDIQGTTWKPRVGMSWAGLEVDDRMTGLKYSMPPTCPLLPFYKKRLQSIISKPYVITLKFRQGQEVSYVMTVCHANCDGKSCVSGMRGIYAGSTLYPQISSFERYHEAFKPPDNLAGSVSAPPATGEDLSVRMSLLR